jgi:DNA-binding MarR family transcriptional regulator
MKAGEAAASGEDAILEMGSACLLMRTRLISRVITAIHDEGLRPLGIGSAQFVLLVVIFAIGPATRADIGRYHHQDRSTLTRNLKIILAQGWAEEILSQDRGRARAIVLTKAGKDLLIGASAIWRMGQAKARALLGEQGAAAVMDIAASILAAPAK